MTKDTRDHTPHAVTLPAYAWRQVIRAVEHREGYLRRRSQAKPAPNGSPADLDGLLASTLTEAGKKIRDAVGL